MQSGFFFIYAKFLTYPSLQKSFLGVDDGRNDTFVWVNDDGMHAYQCS